MANAIINSDVDESEDNIGPTAGAPVTLAYAIVHNTGGATAYFKVWDDQAANVNPAADVATAALVGVPAGATVPVWLGDRYCPNGACMGATVEEGAGATAPAGAFVVTLFTL